MRRLGYLFLFMTGFVISFLSSSNAQAATRTWSNGGGDGLWSTATNWSGNAVPGSGDAVVFNSTSTANCTIDANASVTSFSINSGYSGTVTAGSGKTLSMSNGLTISTGTLNLDAAGTTTINGTFTFNGGVFVTPSSLTATGDWLQSGGTLTGTTADTLTFSGGNAIMNLTNDALTYNVNMVVNKNHGTYLSLGQDRVSNITWQWQTYGQTLTLGGSLTATDGILYNGTIEVQGNATWGSAFDGGNTTINFSGANAQVLTLNGGAWTAANVTINKTNSTDSVTLAGGAWTLNSGGQDLTVTKGLLDLAGNNITVNDSFTFSSNATLKLQGGETITGGPDTLSGPVIYTGTAGSYTLRNWTYTTLTIAGGAASVFTLPTNESLSGNLTITSGILSLAGNNLTVSGTFSNNGTFRLQGGETLTFTPDIDSGTVEYVGSGTYNSLKYGSTYTNLTFSGSGSWTIAAPMFVNGNFTLTTGTFATNGYAMSVAGNWTNSGTFTHGNGTVTLNGTDQTISGSSATTFYNLIKSTKTARTLTFPISVTTSITNLFTAYGASGNLLSLRSASDGVQASVNIAKEIFQYLDVKDVKNTNDAVAKCYIGCVDSGNNQNTTPDPDVDTWAFSLPSGQTATWTFGEALSNYTYNSSNISVSGGLAKLVEEVNDNDVAIAHLADWTKRQVLTVTNSGTTLSYFQVKVSVTYDSDMQADFDDVVFTGSDGFTPLSYWLESKTDSTSAVFWVKVPTLVNGNNTIYMYYGNPTAISASNGTDTFLFFDDFNGSSVDTSLWTDTNPSYHTVSSGVLHTNTLGVSTDTYLSTTLNISAPGILEEKIKYISSNNAVRKISMHISNSNNYWDFMGIESDTQIHALYNNGSTWGSDAVLYATPQAGTYYIYRHVHATDIVSQVLDTNYNSLGSVTRSGYGGYLRYIESGRSQFGYSSFDTDWVRVRQYAATEPSVSFSSETTFNSASDIIAPEAYLVPTPGSFTGWTRARPITINNPGSSLNEQQVEVDVTYDADMQADFDDIRFIDSSGTLLKHWLKSKSNGISAIFWVKIPTLSAGNNTIYMYYKNDTAISTSSFTDTMSKDYSADSNLVAQWQFDEGSGSTAADSSGGSHTASITSPAWLGSDVAAPTGNALQLNGSSTRATTNIAVNSLSNNFTLEAWGLFDNTSAGWQWLFGEGSGGIFVFGKQAGSNSLHYNISGMGSNGSIGSFTQGAWHHFVLSHTKASANSLKIYIDGALVGTYNAQNTSPDSVGVISFGSRPGSEFMQGKLDEMRVYSRALSITEVQSHYQHIKYAAATPTVSIGAEILPAPESGLTIAPSISGTHPPFTTLYSFAENVDATSTGIAYYQLSNNGSDWYWHDGTHWTAVTGPSQYNIAAAVNAVLPDFVTDVGSGAFYFKAFLISDGGQQVALDSLILLYGLPTALNSASSVAVTEGQVTPPTYNVVLSSQPSADVIITPTPSDTSYGVTVSPATLTFTHDNWSTPQTVTVTAVNDTRYEGAHTATITHTSTSSDALFNAMTLSSVTANITDDDSLPTISIGAASATEGSNIVFNVTISNSSSQAITVNYASSNGTASSLTDYGATSGTLTFPAGDDTPRTITVGTTPDTLDEMNETFTMTLSGPTNATLFVASNTGTINDNNSPPSVQWTAASQSSSDETNGATMTVTAQLSTASGLDVTVPFTLSGTATGSGTDYTITASPLTISAGSTTATATITLVGDTLDENNETVILTLGNPTNATKGSTTVHTATITDDDAPPSVQWTAASQSSSDETNGATMTVTAQLSAVSGRDVTVPFTLSGTATGSGTDYTITGSPITITAGSTTADVTITIVGDAIDEANETVIITMGGPTNATKGVTGVHTATITDDDTRGVTLTATGGSTNVTEGNVSTDNYTVVLTSEPTANVIITASPNAQISITPTVLTFTPANWSTPQTITVSSVNDNVAEGAHTGTITHTVSGSSDYNTFSIADLTVNVTDNDSQGVSVIESGGSTNVTESGGTDSYTVVLTSQPTDDVAISLTPNSQVTLSSNLLTFTSGNWNTPQTITVTAVDDHRVEGSHSGLIEHVATSEDDYYDGIPINDVTPVITDNDSASIVITQSLGATAVAESGTTDTYTIVLNSQPAHNVVVTLTVGSGLSTDLTTLTFTSADWDTPQTITVSAVNDSVAEGLLTGTITHASVSADTDYNALTINPVSVQITDNDTAAVTVSKTTVSVTEGGATDTYTVVLGSQPTDTINIAVATTSDQISISPATLSFTTANWNTPQTVTISAINDLVDEAVTSSTITHTINPSTSDAFYPSVTIASVTASTTDNDTAGMTISKTTSSITEGATPDTYTVVLNTKPTSNVVVTPTLITDSASQVSISPTSLTFTTTTWNVPQTVTLTAIDDTTVEEALSATLSHEVVSADTFYNGLKSSSITMTILSDDKPPSGSGGSTSGTDGSGTSSTGGGHTEEPLTVTSTHSAMGLIHVTHDGEEIDLDSHIVEGETSSDRAMAFSVGSSTITMPIGSEGSRDSVVATSTSDTRPGGSSSLVFTSSMGRGMAYIVPRSDLSGDIDLRETTAPTGSISGLTIGSVKNDTTPGVILYGQQDGDHLGEYVAEGDVNGDGIPEILISAPGAGHHGIVYVIDQYGENVASIYCSAAQPCTSIITAQLMGSATLDINFGPANRALNPDLSPVSALLSSQYSPLVTSLEGSSNLQGSIDLAESSDDALIGSGNSYQSIAFGDVNGDGANDLIASTSNSIAIFLGPISSSSSISYSNANYVITGEGGYFGQSLSTADVNHDGMEDILIGAPGYGDNSEGAIYLLFGRPYLVTDSITHQIETGYASQILGNVSNANIGSDMMLQTSSSGALTLYTPEGSSSTLQLTLSSDKVIDQTGDMQVSSRHSLFGSCALDSMVSSDESSSRFMECYIMGFVGLLMLLYRRKQNNRS